MIDDILDVMDEEVSEDYFCLVGVLDIDLINDLIIKIVLKCLLWLIILIFLGMIIVIILGRFEKILENVVLFVVFIFIISGMLGNLGI